MTAVFVMLKRVWLPVLMVIAVTIGEKFAGGEVVQRRIAVARRPFASVSSRSILPDRYGRGLFAIGICA